jgi:hypothetical protein
VQTKTPIEECRKKIWLVDSKVNSSKDSSLIFIAFGLGVPVYCFLLTVDADLLPGLDRQFTQGVPSTLQETVGS